MSPARADAHGIGGLEPSASSAHVVGVTPKQNAFTIRSIENGTRVQLSRLPTAARDITVLGVDNEPYILFRDDGVFENKKSATRLINKSTSGVANDLERNQEFAQTSSDPRSKPIWVAVSSGSTYSWHDHRAHYMGTVPDGITNLGENNFPITYGSQQYRVTFRFVTKAKPSVIPYLTIFLIALVLVVVLFGKFPTFSQRLVRPGTCIPLLTLLGVLEFLHVYGYMRFAQESTAKEFSSSLYAAIVILLSVSGLVTITRSIVKKRTRDEILRKHAPLICAAGLSGFIAGALLEYRVFFEPYLTSTYPENFTRISVLVVAIISISLIGFSSRYLTQPRTSLPNSTTHG